MNDITEAMVADRIKAIEAEADMMIDLAVAQAKCNRGSKDQRIAALEAQVEVLKEVILKLQMNMPIYIGGNHEPIDFTPYSKVKP